MTFAVGVVSVEIARWVSLAMLVSNVALNRCYWRSRRGLLELDLLLPPFVLARFETLSATQRTALQRLLECEDQDIWSWFQQRSAPQDPSLGELVALIRAFNERDSAH